MPRFTERRLLTAHAERRSCQRGFKWQALELLDRYAEIEIPAGHGCVRRFIPRAVLRTLPGGERLAYCDIVEAPDGTILTVQHRYGRRGRKCTRARRGWRRNSRWGAAQ